MPTMPGDDVVACVTENRVIASSTEQRIVALPADDQIIVTGEASQVELLEEFAGGQVARGGRAGLLGNLDFLDAPFSGTAYTSDLVTAQQSDSVGDVLQNDPVVRVAKGFGNFQEVYILRGFQGEAEAGAFHLATAWAALAAIPAFTYSAAARRSIGGAREQGEAGRVAYLALRRALLPTLGAVVVVLPTAIYFMEHPGTTHTLAEYLLLPLIPAWGLRGLEALVLSGLAQRGLHARATTLAAIFTALALGVSVWLALVAGVVAVGWGVLAVRVVFVGVLWVGLRRAGGPEPPRKRRRGRHAGIRRSLPIDGSLRLQGRRHSHGLL